MKINNLMMGVGLTTIIMVSVGMSGCDTPTPISAIPTIIHYFADNETRVFVTGDEYMYQQINITMNNVTTIEDHSYGLTASCNGTDYQLEVKVIDMKEEDDKQKFINYTYQATVRVELDDETAFLFVTDIHSKDEIKRESPYKTIMEKE